MTFQSKMCNLTFRKSKIVDIDILWLKSPKSLSQFYHNPHYSHKFFCLQASFIYTKVNKSGNEFGWQLGDKLFIFACQHRKHWCLGNCLRHTCSLQNCMIQIFWCFLPLQTKTTSIIINLAKKDTLPKAPWPERWVPPPLTRGIRATARPVPQDSADVWWPAYLLTAYGWRLFLAIFVWTKLTTSGRIWAVNTPGRVVCPAFSPVSSKIDIRGLAAWKVKYRINDCLMPLQIGFLKSLNIL